MKKWTNEQMNKCTNENTLNPFKINLIAKLLIRAILLIDLNITRNYRKFGWFRKSLLCFCTNCNLMYLPGPVGCRPRRRSRRCPSREGAAGKDILKEFVKITCLAMPFRNHAHSFLIPLPPRVTKNGRNGRLFLLKIMFPQVPKSWKGFFFNWREVFGPRLGYNISHKKGRRVKKLETDGCGPA